MVFPPATEVSTNVVKLKVQVNILGSDKPFLIPATEKMPDFLDRSNGSTINLPDCTPVGSIVLAYSGSPQFDADFTKSTTERRNIKVRRYIVGKNGTAFTLTEEPFAPDRTPANDSFLELAEAELLPILSLQQDDKIPIKSRLEQIDEKFPGIKIGQDLKPPTGHALMLLGTTHTQVVSGLLTPKTLADYKSSLSVSKPIIPHQ